MELKALQDKDIQLVGNWISKPHVFKWLCPGGAQVKEDWLDELKGRSTSHRHFRHFLAYIGDRPIGFCMYYDSFFEKEYILSHYGLEVDKRGQVFEIGYLIGEEKYLNKGYGKRMIVLIEELIKAEGGMLILADPSEENGASVRVLLAAGFQKYKDEDYRKYMIA